jgi:hypothetical protein
VIDHDYHELEFKIELLDQAEDLGDFDEDRGPAEGLVYGLAISLVIWLSAAALWRFPGLRWPAEQLVATVVFVAACMFGVHKMSQSIQRRHPKSGTVEWFRRNGLL